MPSRRLAQGTLRVSYPTTHTVGRPTRARDLGSTAQVVHDRLLDSLRDNDFTTVEEFQVRPKRARGGPTGPAASRAPAASAAPPAPADPLALDLQVPGDHAAVVLLEQDGCYSWHVPTAATRQAPRTRAVPGELRTVRFEIELRHPGAPAPRATRRRPRRGAATRGLLGDLLSGAVRVTVLRFAAPLLVGKAIDLLERGVRPGIVHIGAPDPASWTLLDRLDQVPLPTDRPARVLLFVHGTFSSTTSAFGILGLTQAGRAFLTTALAHYDAVVGFDHPTLSVDPLANATDLLRRVAGVTTGVTFDVVCHSRGGLTTRSFAEYVLPTAGWNGSVDRAVFVAATNAGTHLADPDRWHDLVDMVTNLTAVGAGVLAAIPGGAPVSAVVAGVVRGLGALVKYLAGYVTDPAGVPGLAAMSPQGAFVTGINQTQPAQPTPGTPWYVVSSDFHVSLLDDSHRPAEFPRELAVRLAEGVVDRIFKGGNDLVVDVASMGSIDATVGGFVADTLAYGTNDEIYHINYFGDDRFVAACTRWLLKAPAAPPRSRSLPRSRPSGRGSGRRAQRRAATPAARRALCVGINEFVNLPMASWLYGCVNDATDMAAMLRTRGWTTADITVLTDADATKDAVLGALTRMVQTAKPGDHLVFSLSSHGTQVPDPDGDERDHADEAFAMHDIRQRADQWDLDTVIVDDELRVLFQGLPSGVLMEVFLDTCHSGTGLRAPDLLVGRRPRYLPPPTLRGIRSLEKADATSVTDVVTAIPSALRPVLYAACRPEQTSADATFEGRANGAFTYHLLKAIATDAARPRQAVVTEVAAALRAGGFTQRPSLEGPPRAKRAPVGDPW
ncbi:MAG: caspase family protein [Dermatophilaceae bacterium]